MAEISKRTRLLGTVLILLLAVGIAAWFFYKQTPSGKERQAYGDLYIDDDELRGLTLKLAHAILDAHVEKKGAYKVLYEHAQFAGKAIPDAYVQANVQYQYADQKQPRVMTVVFNRQFNVTFSSGGPSDAL